MGRGFERFAKCRWPNTTQRSPVRSQKTRILPTPTPQKTAISNLPIAMSSGAQVYNQNFTLTKDAVDVFDVVDDEYVTFRPRWKQPRKEVRRIFRPCLHTASTLHFSLSSSCSD